MSATNKKKRMQCQSRCGINQKEILLFRRDV